MDLTESYQSCNLCPRGCGIDRTLKKPGTGTGFCGETDQPRVAYVGPHFGEEPPITGTRGSGTVFFSGCSLKCRFCQNRQISHDGVGRTVSTDVLLQKIRKMVLLKSVHNLNFVTPDHFLPHVVQLIRRLKKESAPIPTIFNFSGYQSVPVLKRVEEYVDIYLPDFKYADSSLAGRLSGCSDYPQIGINAISEMVGQKGFLDSHVSEKIPSTRGVMVRHLILPGFVENSINALTMLFIEFGSRLPLSLMSQYHPVIKNELPALNRTLAPAEFEAVFDHAKQLGFERMFIQFPESPVECLRNRPSFVPDFKRRQPFK